MSPSDRIHTHNHTASGADLPTTPGSRPVHQPARTVPDRFAWLAPMVLWPLARRHLPRPAVRPQGGGTQRADDEAMFAAIVYVLVSGDPWRSLPRTFTVSWQNTHRRFIQWSEGGLWDRVQYTARNPQIPLATRQWADHLAALAGSRTGARRPQPGEAVEEANSTLQRIGPSVPVIRVHKQDEFADRLFGPGRNIARRPGPQLA